MDAEHKVYLWYLIIAVVALCIGYWIGKETTACASEFMVGNLTLRSMLPNIPSPPAAEVYTFDNADIQYGALIAARLYSRDYSDSIVKSVWQQYFPNIGDINQIFTPHVDFLILSQFNNDNCTGAVLFLKVLADKNPSLSSNVHTLWSEYFARYCGNRL